MDTYLTADEAAVRIGISLRAVRDACRSGELPSRRYRTAYLISTANADAFKAKREAEGIKGRAAARRRNKAAREARRADGGGA